MRAAAALPLLAAALCRAAVLQPPASAPLPAAARGASRRAFLDTAWGQLHYVHSRGVAAAAHVTLFLHGDPRSSAEFGELLYGAGGLAARTGFVAVDYFGLGHSDDCDCPLNTTAPCVGVAEFGELALQVLDAVGVAGAVNVVGNLRGSETAIHLAAAAPSRVRALVFANTLYLVPGSQGEAMLRNFIESLKHPALSANGSHLLPVWEDASDVDIMPEQLEFNEAKTVDALRCLGTHWQYELLGLAFNADKLQAIGRVRAPTLVLWGGGCVAGRDAYGFNASVTKGMISDALHGGAAARVQVTELPGCTEGMLETNASAVAPIIRDFLFQ